MAKAAGDNIIGIPKRRLGNTGERLSIIGMGGIVVMGGDSHSADRIVSRAIERGVNYFDVAPSYGNGEAEELLGGALKPYRDQVFLACKTGARDKVGAAGELKTSLKRLQTDHVDLYQMHGFTRVDEVEQALGPGGAIETFLEARDNGLTRFLGFSAHSEEAACLAIDRFNFDTVLFPINWVCWSHGGFGSRVIEKANEKGMGILALKGLARGPWSPSGNHDYPKCWYQPVTDPKEADLALRFTLSQPITAAVPPGDERIFDLALSIAENFKEITEEEQKEIQTRAAEITPIFYHE